MIDDLGESLEDSRCHRRAARQQRLLLATTAAPAESYYRREYLKTHEYGSNKSPPSHFASPSTGLIDPN